MDGGLPRPVGHQPEHRAHALRAPRRDESSTPRSKEDGRGAAPEAAPHAYQLEMRRDQQLRHPRADRAQRGVHDCRRARLPQDAQGVQRQVGGVFRPGRHDHDRPSCPSRICQRYVGRGPHLGRGCGRRVVGRNCTDRLRAIRFAHGTRQADRRDTLLELLGLRSHQARVPVREAQARHRRLAQGSDRLAREGVRATAQSSCSRIQPWRRSRRSSRRRSRRSSWPWPWRSASYQPAPASSSDDTLPQPRLRGRGR